MREANAELIAKTYNQKPTEDFITETPVVEQQDIFANRERIEEKNKEEEIHEYLAPKIQEAEQSAPVSEETEETEEANYREFNTIEKNEAPKEEVIEQEQEVSKIIEQEAPVRQEILAAAQHETIEVVQDEPEEEAEEETYEDPQITEQEMPQEIQKTITVFYGQNSSGEKVNNIHKYRELLYNKKDFSLNEITSLINEIKTQADTNISELQIFLDKLKSTNHAINLLTNSQSANLVDLLSKNDITYSIFDSNNENRVNLMPLLGLTNLYICPQCNRKYLDTNEKINSFFLQCPKCKGVMFPELYTPEGEINMDYYNSSIMTLANSDTWLLIHPSLNEKLTFNMIKTSIKVSSNVKKVYIIDTDINTKETYKRLIEETNSNIKVSAGINAIEEFFNNI